MVNPADLNAKNFDLDERMEWMESSECFVFLTENIHQIVAKVQMLIESKFQNSIALHKLSISKLVFLACFRLSNI